MREDRNGCHAKVWVKGEGDGWGGGWGRDRGANTPLPNHSFLHVI